MIHNNHTLQMQIYKNIFQFSMRLFFFFVIEKLIFTAGNGMENVE